MAKPRRQPDPPMPPVRGDDASPADSWVEWFIPGLVILVIVGALALTLPGTMAGGRELHPGQALLASANAATLTGFRHSFPLEDYRPAGQLIVAAILIAATAITLIAWALALNRILRLSYSDRYTIGFALSVQGAALLIGTVALLAEGQRTTLQALILSAAAFGTCGVHAGAMPAAGHGIVHALLLPLGLLGALGMPVLMELYDRARGATRRISRHAWVALASIACTYLAGMLLLMLLTGSHLSLEQSAIRASAVTLSASAWGAPFAEIRNLPAGSVWVLLTLMLLGMPAGGSGGGIRPATLYTLASGARRMLAGQPPPGGMAPAVLWLGLYAALLLAGALIVAITQPELPADRLLFIVVSAVSNVGLSHESLMLGGYGEAALALLMLLGRLAPLQLAWYLARRRYAADVM